MHFAVGSLHELNEQCLRFLFLVLVMHHILQVAQSLAGEEILDVYNKSFKITLKDDLSPLTDADRRSNDVITDKLSCFYPDIPILSEEGKDVKYLDRKNWDMFWLIDPLDGTKE